jgi:hypothetical protein
LIALTNFPGFLVVEPMEFTLCFAKIISYFDCKKPLPPVESRECRLQRNFASVVPILSFGTTIWENTSLASVLANPFKYLRKWLKIFIAIPNFP